MNVINSNKNIEDANREDRKVMDALLGLTTDEQAWQQQQARQKPRFKSGSMTFGRNDKHRNVCTRCGMTAHDPIICPFAGHNLLADRE